MCASKSFSSSSPASRSRRTWAGRRRGPRLRSLRPCAARPTCRSSIASVAWYLPRRAKTPRSSPARTRANERARREPGPSKLGPLLLAAAMDVALDLVLGLIVGAVLGREGTVALDLVAWLVVRAVLGREGTVALDLVAWLVVRAVLGRECAVALDLGLLVLALLLRHCSSFRSSCASYRRFNPLDVTGGTNLPIDPSNSQRRLRSCVAWAATPLNCRHSGEYSRTLAFGTSSWQGPARRGACGPTG